MFFALRGLPVLIELGLLIYCLIDAIQTPAHEVRNLPKAAWVVLIVLVPLVGGIAWLVAGRPVGGRARHVPWPSGPTAGLPEYERPRRGPVAPDDDPAFLAQLRKVDDEHEQTLRRWEEDLRRRERELRADPAAGPVADPGVEPERGEDGGQGSRPGA
jgi:Phospholipase_D-nuclease N-terminal